jgi:hypothetical protein
MMSENRSLLRNLMTWKDISKGCERRGSSDMRLLWCPRYGALSIDEPEQS